MTSTLVSKVDSIWFKRHNYKIVPLTPSPSEPMMKLQQAIEHGIHVCADSNRPDFYDVDLADAWAYIHVREHARIIYVIACARFGELEAVV